MNRASSLLLLAVVIAGGLGYFAVMGPGAVTNIDLAADGPVVITRPADSTARTPPPDASRADLAAVNPDRATLDSGMGSGFVREWEIIPMNSVGQTLASAKITATRGDVTKVAEGRVSWTAISSGTWSLVIEAEGQPRWERTVLLEAAKRTRTVARLGDEIRIRGTVVDTNGEPVVRATLYFLPKGERHPEDAVPLQPKLGARGEAVDPNSDKGRAIQRAKEVASMGRGKTIAVRTGPGGHFRAVVPKSGEWRVSVGPVGEARWTQTQGTVLRNGGPDRLLVTVPALATLSLRFSGAEDERPSQVTVYSFDARLATRVANQLASAPANVRGTSRTVSVEQAEIETKNKAIARGVIKGSKQIESARNSFEESQDTALEGLGYGTQPGVNRPERAPLFEPGWRAIRSVPVTGGETVISQLPGQKDLKFLFVRGNERVTTASVTRLRDGARSEGTARLPRAKGESAGVVQSNLASISIRVVADDKATEAKPGVAWSYLR